MKRGFFIIGILLCVQVANAQKQLTILKNTSANAKLQPFTATDINGKKVSNKQLDAPINIVMAWASWNAESGSIQRVVRKLQKKNPGKIAAITLCLDAKKAPNSRSYALSSATE